MKAGVAPHERRRKPNEPTKAVTKSMDKSEILLRALMEFISRSQVLETITFDNVKLSADILQRFGDALSAMGSKLQTLTIVNCPIGSIGLRTLTPHINKLHSLNVLTIDNCGLTNDSMMYLAAIVRASESHMDQTYWNASLRMDDDGGLASPGSDSDDMRQIYYSGLVMLDVSRNALTAESMPSLARLIKANHWLLGLNLRGNSIDASGLAALCQALQENSALETILLGNNPGFQRSLAMKVRSIVKRDMTRLDGMPNSLFEVFSKWNMIQTQEAEEEQNSEQKKIVENVQMQVRKQQKGTQKTLTSQSTNSHNDVVENVSQRTPVRVPGVINWNEGEDNGVSAPFDDAQNRDSLEFAIPTPKSGDAFNELSNSPEASPALSILSKTSGDFPNDGRPPSRNSLRPRSAQSFEVKAQVNASQISAKSSRASLPIKWSKLDRNSIAGESAERPRSAGASNGIVSASMTAVGNSRTKFPQKPFYPSGSAASSLYNESRASNALERRRALFRGETSISTTAPRISKGPEVGVSQLNGTRPKVTHRKKKGKRSRANIESGQSVSNRLDILTTAVEMVTHQLQQTAEKLVNVSDSLSETALNLSLTPMGQAAASNILGLSQLNTSIGSIGADISRSSPQSTPVRSHHSSAKNSPGSPPRAQNGTSHNSPSKASAVNKISKAQTVELKNEELKTLIRESMRNKLNNFLATS